MVQGKLEPVITTSSSQAAQQMDCDSNQTTGKGESNAVCTHTSEPSRKHDVMSGILRIVPSHTDVRNPNKPHQTCAVLLACCLQSFLLQVDSDYWFTSDVDASTTDAWGT